jgi:uroporphyrinogen-III decarboxylase
MADYYRDLGLSVNEENLEAVRVAREGKSDRYFAWEAIGESPLMHFVEHLAGVENAHYLLYDAPDGVFDLFEAMHEHLTAKTTMVCEITEADMVAFIENTSTTLISPTQYRSIDLPHLVTYARIARDHSRRFALHMCGFLKDILPDVDKVGASVFEAFTSPPVGNTPFAVGREQCPDVCLIGGTNASLWLEPAAGIIEEIDRSLSELPHHRGIVVSSAGVMPPACPPETIQAVREFVTSYPVRV